MGLRFIRISLFASPRLLCVLYIQPVEGVSRYQQISIQRWDKSARGIGRSKCRRNAKVLTSKALRNLRLQDAATKVGVLHDVELQEFNILRDV